MDQQNLKHKHLQNISSISQQLQNPTLSEGTPTAECSRIAEATTMDASYAQAMADDEKVARQLQEEFDKAEPPPLSIAGMSNFASDEQIAQMLQEEEDMQQEFFGDQDLEDHDWGPPPVHPPRKKSKLTAKKVSKPATKLIDGEVLDRSEDAVRVYQFASQVASLSCPICHHSYLQSKAQLVELSDSIQAIIKAGSGEIECSFMCHNCQMKVCCGCGELHRRPHAFGSPNGSVPFTWHCDFGRCVMIWLLLCGYDTHAEHNKARSIVPDAQAKGKKERGTGYSTHSHDYAYYSEESEEDELDPEDIATDVANQSDGPNPWILKQEKIAYEKKNKKGTPPGFYHSIRKRGLPKSPFQVREDPDDELSTHVMSGLCALLPAPTEQLAPTEFDVNPPMVLISLLLRSSILDRIAELLRNNSLEDATKRFTLYNILLRFVRLLSEGGPPTAALLLAERPNNRLGHDLLKVSFAVPTRLKGEKEETSSTLVSCIADLKSQSQVMQKSAAARPAEFETDDAQQMLLLCASIVECSAVLPNLDPTHVNTNMAAPNQASTLHDWQKDLAVLEVPDEDILSSHYYAKEARNLQAPPIGRMRQMVNELAKLKTGLPPNIFVRHGESRLDVMKFVIVGPKDTPYENGLFEFDLLCPKDYPNTPPQVHFKTTGGGTVTINPNLYADGKVCLSLLGTWQGEPWQPGTSTLLQVLISMQAMIFVPDPYGNEPGRESLRNGAESKRYNRQRYPETVQFGMIEWIEGKRSPDSYRRRRISEFIAGPPPPAEGVQSTPGNGKVVDLWPEVARKHFEANKQETITTVNRWVEEVKNAKDAAPRGRKKKVDSISSRRSKGSDIGSGDQQNVQTRLNPNAMSADMSLLDTLKKALPELKPHYQDYHGHMENELMALGMMPSTTIPVDPAASYAITSPTGTLTANHPMTNSGWSPPTKWEVYQAKMQANKTLQTIGKAGDVFTPSKVPTHPPAYNPYLAQQMPSVGSQAYTLPVPHPNWDAQTLGSLHSKIAPPIPPVGHAPMGPFTPSYAHSQPPPYVYNSTYPPSPVPPAPLQYNPMHAPMPMQVPAPANTQTHGAVIPPLPPGLQQQQQDAPLPPGYMQTYPNQYPYGGQ